MKRALIAAAKTLALIGASLLILGALFAVVSFGEQHIHYWFSSYGMFLVMAIWALIGVRGTAFIFISFYENTSSSYSHPKDP